MRLSLIEDFSHLDATAFWREMERRGLIFPYGVTGRRQEFEKMPQSLRELSDDPFRGLAALVRRTGEYPEKLTPFAELKWADYFRHRISLAALRTYPELALQCATKLARNGTSICEKCDTAFSGICGSGRREGTSARR